MKAFIVVLAVIASAQAGSRLIRRNASGGWPAETTTTAAPSGWGQPTGSLSSIDVNAAISATGSGSASENHSGEIAVTGAGGWGGPNAQLYLLSGGESNVNQDGVIVQATDLNNEGASSVQAVSFGQSANANELQVLDALGLDVTNNQNGAVAVAGSGASNMGASNDILINPPQASSMGLAHP